MAKLPERAHHPRLDQLELAEQVVLAGVDLLRQRVAVPGRPALERRWPRRRPTRVRPISPSSVLQQPPGLADERQALLVLVRARGLADEHQLGVRVARAEDDRGPGRGELGAACAGRRLLPDGLELLAPVGCGGHGADAIRTISADVARDPRELSAAYPR